MDEQLRSDLSKLFQMTERDAHVGDSDQLGVTVGSRGDFITVRGDAFHLLHDIADALAQPASESGGPSAREAESLILRACRRYFDDGETEALDWLDSKLSEVPSRWTVIRPTTIRQMAQQVVLGECRFQRGLPNLPIDPPDDWKRAFPAFTVSVQVQARDEDSAEVVAALKFAEALAVVQLADRGSVNFLGPARVLLRDDGIGFFRTGPPGGTSMDYLGGRNGTLFPRFQALSDALVKPQRTDWESRTLTAARWLRKALETEWPNDSLISQMVALEALFVRESSGKERGVQIAEAVSAKLPPLRTKTRDEQEKWIKTLYTSRSRASHYAGQFENEAEIDRLADLTFTAVGWAAAHLNPLHRRARQPCQTQKEALSCDPW